MDIIDDKNTFLVQFGQTLKELRKAKNLTQTVLAEYANLSENYYGKLERGERNISIYQFYKIAAALKLDLNAFFLSIDKSNVNKDYLLKEKRKI